MKKVIEISRKAADIFCDALAAAKKDYKAAYQALEDGEYLLNAGYTDSDQLDIEEAHDALKGIFKGEFDDFTTPESR